MNTTTDEGESHGSVLPSFPPYVATPPQRNRTPAFVWWLIGIPIMALVLCTVAAVAIGGFAAFWVTHQVTQTTTTTQTFSVSGTPMLVIDQNVGNISIATGQPGQVIVTVEKHASDVSADNARHSLETMTASLDQSGDTITIRTAASNDHPFTMQSVDLVITTPSATNLSITMDVGSLAVDGLSGAVSATDTTGDMEFTHATLQGTSHLSVTTGNLSINGTLASGATLDARVVTGNATLRLPASTSASVSADATVGNVTIQGWAIPVNRQVARASASGTTASHPNSSLSVHVTTGNISILSQ